MHYAILTGRRATVVAVVVAVTYNPNFAGNITLTSSDNLRSWSMKGNPYVGVFDPYTLAVRFNW